jgi:anhydro-N-acetylmuramic acid kinase
LKSLQRLLKNKPVLSTEQLGLHPNWVEATAFAWLAYRTFNRQTGNLPSVTGARRAVVLGAIYLA